MICTCCQNDLFYENEVDNHGIIPYAELEQMTHTELTEKLRCFQAYSAWRNRLFRL